MKRFCAVLAFFLFSAAFMPTAGAYKLTDGNLLQEADLYAVTRRNLDWDAFFAPWTAFEEKSAALKPPSERTIVYTPFLLVAMEKKQAINQNQVLDADKIDALLKSYAGSFVVSVILRDSQPFTQESLSAILQQDGRVVKPHYLHAEPAVGLTEQGKTNFFAYETRVYFYFPQAQVNPNLSASLLVFAANQNARRFLLPLANFS